MAYRPRTRMGVEVMHFPGDLDAPHMVQVKDRISRLIKKNRKKVLMDLSDTKRVELAGLGILVDRLRTLRAHNGDIKFYNMRPEVRKALEMIGINGLIESFHSKDEAIQSFAA